MTIALYSVARLCRFNANGSSRKIRIHDTRMTPRHLEYIKHQTIVETLASQVSHFLCIVTVICDSIQKLSSPRHKRSR